MDQNELKSLRFRTEREVDWRRLETVLDHFERGRTSSLSDEDVIAIPVLYRSALSSLSAARAVSLDQNLIAYLESLCTRSYFCVYGVRTSVLERFGRFLLSDWRESVLALWRETIASAAFGILGAITSFVVVWRSPEWFFSFVPAGLSGGRDPGASTQALRKVLFEAPDASGLTFFSSFLFTHNAEIALLSFALGFACCLPTVFLLFSNGLMLGAMLAVYARHGLAVELGGWLLIHGVTELLAITLSGAAGFRIGWTLAFPGSSSRLDALTTSGRAAATTMIGVVIMLAIAGLLEGFARQMITSTAIRYAVAGLTAVSWGVFYYGPRRT